MILVGSQKMRNVSWVLFVVKDTASVMHNSRFFSQPSNTNTQVHVIFSCTYYHNIIWLGEA